MKKIILLAFCFLAQLAAHAQTDSIKVEQYCQVIATPKLLSKKFKIELDAGEAQVNRLKNNDEVFKKLNTVIDVLNFMGEEGWIFINAYPIKNNDTETYHYVFKKMITVTRQKN